MVMIDKDAKGFKGNTPLKFGSSKSKKKSTSRTVVTPGTKVSQATIDKIKSMGMSAALKGASGASAEMQEGLRRMYGASRVKAAMGTSKPSRAVMARPGSTPKSSAPGAISGKAPVKMTKSNAPSAVSGRKVSTTSTSKTATPKKVTNKNLKPGSLAYNIANNKGIFGNKK
jgi:hypothetical protein